MALPLRAADRTFGALTIYASTPDAFSAQDVELLTGLADDLAFGITTLRTRASAEMSLRNSERSLAEARRIAHIGSWEWDLATDTGERSDETYRIVGVERGAFPRTSEAFLAFLAFVHPDDRARVQASARAAIDGGARHDLDYRIVRPNGAVRIVQERAEIIRDPSGTPLRMVGTVQDITERVQLEAQQTRLARLLDEVSSEIYVSDTETMRLSGANAGALRNLGYSLDELRQLTPIDLKPELTAATFAELITPLRNGTRYFVKLDIGLTRGIDADPARQALIAGIGYFAPRRKPRLIAEGIETVAELQALRQLGIDYGQGYLLGTPQDGRRPGPWPTKISIPAS